MSHLALPPGCSAPVRAEVIFERNSILTLTPVLHPPVFSDRLFIFQEGPQIRPHRQGQVFRSPHPSLFKPRIIFLGRQRWEEERCHRQSGEAHGRGEEGHEGGGSYGETEHISNPNLTPIEA